MMKEKLLTTIPGRNKLIKSRLSSLAPTIAVAAMAIVNIGAADVAAAEAEAVPVTVDNFVRAVTDPRLLQPLVYVTLWTFAFALISVASTFFLGLFLAIVFNDLRMRGRKYYRVAMILPYAIPSFLSALIWAGMMNESFGFINQVLFGEVTLYSDPFEPGVEAPPFHHGIESSEAASVFDNGLALSRTDWVRGGVLQQRVSVPASS